MLCTLVLHYRDTVHKSYSDSWRIKRAESETNNATDSSKPDAGEPPNKKAKGLQEGQRLEKQAKEAEDKKGGGGIRMGNRLKKSSARMKGVASMEACIGVGPGIAPAPPTQAGGDVVVVAV